MYKTLDEFKADCLFFPKGKIVPQYIIKGKSKKKHHITFGADTWVHFTPRGHLYLSDIAAGGPNACFIRVDNVKNIHLVMSPYSQGRTGWIMNKIHDDAEKSYCAAMLEIINRRLK